MTSRADAAIIIVLGAPLVFLYGYFLWWLYANDVFTAASTLERALLYTQVLRVAVVMSIKRLRGASVALVWDLMSLEMFCFAGLIALYVAYGSAWFLSLALAMAVAWPSAVICVAPSYWIYKILAHVRDNGRLSNTMTGSVALFALLAFVIGAISRASPPGGLAGFSSLLLTSLVHTRSIVPTQEAEYAGIPLYVALAIYAATKDAGKGYAEINPALFLAFFGTFAAIALGVFAAFENIPAVLAFSFPGSLIITVLWWATRAR